jgi:hypothetical protein
MQSWQRAEKRPRTDIHEKPCHAAKLGNEKTKKVVDKAMFFYVASSLHVREHE